jgi:acetolactate synthase-1/2/3 large subunit
MQTEILDKQKKTQEENAEITGSQALLEALIIEGVNTIFGYPGGAIMPIYDALYDYNDKLEHQVKQVLFLLQADLVQQI